jgi:hypothetical protein
MLNTPALAVDLRERNWPSFLGRLSRDIGLAASAPLFAAMLASLALMGWWAFTPLAWIVYLLSAFLAPALLGAAKVRRYPLTSAMLMTAAALAFTLQAKLGLVLPLGTYRLSSALLMAAAMAGFASALWNGGRRHGIADRLGAFAIAGAIFVAMGRLDLLRVQARAVHPAQNQSAAQQGPGR